MAIKIKSLETIANTYTEQLATSKQQYIYSDLTLDIGIAPATTQPGYPNVILTSDVNVSYDYQAIANSLTNLFNTQPGQRFLFPDFGLDLRQFLFTPVTEINARNLGNTLLRGITNYEPRVNVININVIALPDNNQYNIALILGFPTLNTTQTVNYKLDLKNQTFIQLPNTN
jgi:phage baseplate assembly protein W